ncbi:MAG TPA: hypothetical protein VG276_27875 [Actinomycetes bacterium]|jgi:hypothetical protein|nr:hypothetical protein [Actinomycetes bacterium]
MATVRVNRNLEAELTGHLGEGGPLERALGDFADEIAIEGQWIARREFYRTGAYMDSIEAESGMNEHGELVGRVYATDFKAHWAEFGTQHMAARHILARAAQRVGFRVLVEGTLGTFGPPTLLAVKAIGRRRRRQIGGRRQRAISGSTGRRAITGR